MASPSTEVLIRMLEPWLAHARPRLVLEIGPFPQMTTLVDNLWIQWKLPKDGKFAVEDAETMELLELLARVDNYAAWKLLLEITKNSAHLNQVVDASTRTDATGTLFPSFEIVGLDRATQRATLQQVLRWLLFAIEPSEHSPMYYAVRQTLLQAWTDRHHSGRAAPFARAADDRIRLKFDVDVGALTVADATHCLEMILEVASLTKNPDRLELSASWRHASGASIKALSDTFTLDCIYINLSVDFSSEILSELVQRLVASSGIPVRELAMEAVTRVLPPLHAVSFNRSVVITKGEVAKPAILELYWRLGIWHFGAVCSALPVSPHVKVFRVYFEPADNADNEHQDHRHFWAWIAYSVFSAESSSAIKTVNIDLDELTLEHALVFERVLEARDPLFYVARCLEGTFEVSSAELSACVPMVADIAPFSTLLVAKDRVELCTNDQVESVRVVQDMPDKKHVQVLYPGAGICWIHRSQILQRREMTTSRTSTSAVDKLRLFVSLFVSDITDPAAVTRIISAVGRSLRHVVLDGDAFFDNEFFSRLFVACPRLQRLDLIQAEVDSFEWIRSCGLQTFSVSGVKPRGDRSHQDLLDIVAGGVSRLVDLHIQLPATTLNPMMVDVERMLCRNSTLERVFLSVRDDEPEKELVKTLVERLEKQSGTALEGQRAPLPSRSKLAFLSVAAAVGQTSPEAVCSLDTDVIGWIFAFAAVRKQRVCGFVRPVLEWCGSDEEGDDGGEDDDGGDNNDDNNDNS